MKLPHSMNLFDLNNLFELLGKIREDIGKEVQFSIDSSGMMYIRVLQTQEQLYRFDDYYDVLLAMGRYFPENEVLEDK
jgi:hypothetical protein